jgi:PncC family amidohydrolase
MKELVGIAEQIAKKLIARKQTIAVAESSTGGLIAASLLAVPGASAYFLGGAVVYTRDARRVLMDISDEGMKGFRSSSEPYAKLLSEQMRGRFSSDWGLSETGAAGPTGNRYGDAAGHSCMAVAGACGGGDDAGNREQRPLRQHAGVCGDGAEAVAEEAGGVTTARTKRVGTNSPHDRCHAPA